ncbi:MAG: DUF5658 family protein [Planctomycetota bacterium]
MHSARVESRSYVLGLPANTVAILILFLAAVDGLATIRILQHDRGYELNPLMALLIEHGEATFLLVKLLATALCVKVIQRSGSHPYARLACVAGLAIYVPIVGLHIYNTLMVSAQA